jgi:hypothetical protein
LLPGRREYVGEVKRNSHAIEWLRLTLREGEFID